MHPSWNDYPHLVAELDPDGNKDLTFHGNPIQALELIIGTNKRLDWKCSTCGHKWKAAGAARKSGNGCSCCNLGTLHSEGINSMAETHPELAKEYLGDATQIVAGTHKMLSWKCSTCEHQWETRGNKRSIEGTGCPACINHVVNNFDARNSMAFTHPDLASEYQGDATKIIAGVMDILDWKCSICDHEWQVSGNNRTTHHSGCPLCGIAKARKNRIERFINERGTLCESHPEIAKEALFDTTQYHYGSDTKLPFKCSVCNHISKVEIYKRVGGQGCASCATTGFQPDQLGYYYVHKILNDYGETIMYKAGISGDWKKRLRELRRGIPNDLTMELHEVIDFEIGQDARDLETTLLRMAAEGGWKAPPRKFDGGHELFLENPLDHARTHGLIP